jgi:acyl carrier protein
MGNSDKEIQVSDQIGYLGLGLDSLALVTFVTELENQYGIQFPEDFWVEQDQLTLQHFVDEIVGSDRSSRPSSAISKTTITRKSKAYDDSGNSPDEFIASSRSGSYWPMTLNTARSRSIGRL